MTRGHAFREEEDRESDFEEEEAVEGNSDNRMQGSSSRGHLPASVPMPGQGDIERQRDLQEALLLQMDMQKRLHEQLEVCSSSNSNALLLLLGLHERGFCIVTQ